MNDIYEKETEPFSGNTLRISMRELVVLALALFLVGIIAGMVWNRLERFEPVADYRIPYQLSDDYWHFDRFCRSVGESGKSFLIGDSFVWGQYAPMAETLSSHLNREAGREAFVNAGLDGGHPLALEGLIRYHCNALRDREVILHLNLLWLSSREADLQLERQTSLNHPRLLPQFSRAIPGYRASLDERIGVVLARHFPILLWPRHLQDAYLSGSDLARWTLDNPYRSPVGTFSFRLPEPAANLQLEPRSWFADGTTAQAPPWIELGTSLQWKAFERLVEVLLGRGNSVFVIVGPLNEHMLEPSSVQRYRDLLGQVGTWLTKRELPHFIPPPLPSPLYADMSHPLGPGYALLARDLWERLSG